MPHPWYFHFIRFIVSCTQFLLKFRTPHNTGQATKMLTSEQKSQIINECVEDMISPVDLAKKWGCNPDTIRAWVRKAGKVLPKTYKKSAFSERAATPGYVSTSPGLVMCQLSSWLATLVDW